MGTITASMFLMRWELFSALMMFFASTFNVKCRQRSRRGLAFIFTGVGIGMSCWFVTGLLGITFSAEHMAYMWDVISTAFVETMSRAPADWPIP
ncbi:hypothetical protein CIG19_13615 [Enterobacterales bacterium CwR94]|nr:hypothetical protein CIG19_13615 [Enterobacterales bacterium CwR94]